MAEVENNVATANLTTNQVENFKILGGAYLSYTPLKGLTFKLMLEDILYPTEPSIIDHLRLALIGKPLRL